MLNYFIKNELNGINKSQELCSCGYSNIKESKEGSRYVYSKNTCPECGAVCISNLNNIFFGEKQLKSIILTSNFTHNNYYDIEFRIGVVETSIKTNFIDEKIDLNTDESCLKVYNKIAFNGKNKKEDMIKFFDIKNDKELTEKEFMNALSDCYSDYEIHNDICKSQLEHNTILELPYINVASNIKTSMKQILKQLVRLQEYCVEKEILIKSDINPYRLTGDMDTDKSNTSSQLNLNPFMVKFLKEHGEQHHRALQFIQENFKEQAVNYLNTFGQLDNGLSIYSIRKISTLVANANLSIKKLYKFLYQDAPMQQGLYNPNETLNLLYDSYDLATKLELPFDKNPRALVRYHDILNKEYDTATDDRKNELFAKTMQAYKRMELIEKEEEKPEDLENPDDKPKVKKQLYAMVLPKDAQDLIREGKLMRHCVASYVDRVIREECLIFFLRHADDLETPFVTIEVDPDTNTIRQVKCKANSKLKDVKAEKFIHKWCKKTNVKWNGSW